MYRVEVSPEGDSFKVKSKDYEFAIGVKGKGITPPDALLASLAGCLGVYLRKYAEGAKLNLNEFLITAEAEFTKEPPFSFKAIKVIIDLKGLALDERRQKALLAFIGNCPVHNTLKASPEVEVKIL
ncbi:MAG: OsmC family protein [Deltaproteobacteria bacterium]